MLINSIESETPTSKKKMSQSDVELARAAVVDAINAVRQAQDAVRQAQDAVSEASDDLKKWKNDNPGYSGDEPGYNKRDAALYKASDMLEKREAALDKAREAVLQLTDAMAPKHNVKFENDLMRKLDDLIERQDVQANFFFEEITRRYLYTNDKITKVSRNQKFKHALLSYYYDIKMPVRSVKCMVSGQELPSATVIAGHIFKHSWKDSCFEILGFNDIDDPRNGFLLFKPFEHAFDNSQICFQYSTLSGDFEMKILDGEIREMTLRKYILKNHIKCNNILDPKELWLSSIKNSKKYTDEQTEPVKKSVENLQTLLDKQFKEFECKTLTGSSKKCYARCLSFQAKMARHLAFKNGWISHEEYVEPQPSAWSDLEGKKKKQIDVWLESIHNAQESRVVVSE